MKKIGIITYAKSNNYGARIQAVAVYEIYKKLGYDVEIINIDYVKRYSKFVVGRLVNISRSLSEFLLKYVITYKMAVYTRKNLKFSKHLVTLSNNKMINYINARNYYAVICGSDEIWSARTEEIAPPSIYFLPKEIKAKRIAFAPSANGDHCFSERENVWLKQVFKEYSLIGARDKKTYGLVRERYTGNRLHLIFDPAFCLDYQVVPPPKVLRKRTLKKKICFIMARPYNHFPENIMKALGNENYEYYSVFSKVRGTRFLAISPEQFMSISLFVDLVYTNFFHQAIFSMRNNSNVIVLDTFKKYLQSESKVEDLVNRLECKKIFYSVISTRVDYGEIVEHSINLLSGNGKIDFKEKVSYATACVENFIEESVKVIEEKD